MKGLQMQKAKILLAIAMAVIVVSSSQRTSFGQDGSAAQWQELDAYLTRAAAEDAFSGVVLVAKGTQAIFKKAYGMANRSTNTPNNVDTKLNLGSMNKMFTAVAIAQLAERGKLSFTDTVGKLLPDYPNKAVAEKVTVHHLLTHTSGIGNYYNEAYLANLDKMTIGWRSLTAVCKRSARF